MRLTTYLSVLIFVLALGGGRATLAQEDNKALKFSGVVWASYWHAISGGPGNASNGVANSFDIKRVYLNAAGELDESWSWKVTYEFGGNPQLFAFAKAAFLKWNVGDSFGQSVTFGLQPTLTWGTSEAYWGYRVVMNAPRERFNASVVAGAYGLTNGAAADFGISYSIKPIDLLKLTALVSNGAGHKTPESNQHKKISFTAGVSPIPKSIVEVYFEDEAGYSFVDQNGETQKVNRSGLGVFAGYKVEKFGFGVDYFQKVFADKVALNANGNIEASSNLISLFGNYGLNDKLRLLGRYDMFTPVADEDFLGLEYGGKSGESLLIAGIDCSYGPPNTHFIISYHHTSYEAKIAEGADWVDRDPYSAVVLDVALSF